MTGNNNCQPAALSDSLTEDNHNTCNSPKIIKFIIPTMWCIVAKYVGCLGMLFYPFRSENELIDGTSQAKQR